MHSRAQQAQIKGGQQPARGQEVWLGHSRPAPDARNQKASSVTFMPNRTSPTLPAQERGRPALQPARASAARAPPPSQALFLEILRFLAILLLFDASNNNQYLSLGWL